MPCVFCCTFVRSLAKSLALKAGGSLKSCLKKLKKALRIIQKLKHSTSKDEAKKQAKTEQVAQAHQKLIDLSATYLKRVEETIAQLANRTPSRRIATGEAQTVHCPRQAPDWPNRTPRDERRSHTARRKSFLPVRIAHGMDFQRQGGGAG